MDERDVPDRLCRSGVAALSVFFEGAVGRAHPCFAGVDNPNYRIIDALQPEPSAVGSSAR